MNRMDKDKIVVITQMDDAHADDVISTLQHTGHDPIRLNTDDLPMNATMSLSLERNNLSWEGSIEILTNGRAIDADAVRSIWWRRPAGFGLPTDLSEQEREFASDEIDAALRGLWASLDCYWISHPENIRQASWKVEQLQRAARLGFGIPRTLITTDPEQARAFYDSCDGQMIFKVLTDPFLGAPKMVQKHPDQSPPEPYHIGTTLITDSELDLLDAVRLTPCIFQEYVPKQLELRVTIIGDEIFGAAIHSQADERTSIDWRNYDADIPYHVAHLPTEVAERCLAFVRSYGLNFSSMDLILTPEEQYVFIENNPNGQFIFVEHRVPELGMTEALASCLKRGTSS